MASTLVLLILRGRNFIVSELLGNLLPLLLAVIGSLNNIMGDWISEINGDFFGLGNGRGKFFMHLLPPPPYGWFNDGLDALKTDEAGYQLIFLPLPGLLCTLLMPIRSESAAECPTPAK